MSAMTEIAELLEASKDEDEIIINRALLTGWAQALREAEEVGQLRASVAGASLDERLMAALRGWATAAAQPVTLRTSESGLRQAALAALATAKASIPATMPAPDDRVLQLGMIAILRSLKAALRA